jgi:UDP-N-acetylmuramate--alanine ligase
MKHLHFMGIAGIGMSGLARWAHADGFMVSGCDRSDNATMQALEALGIRTYVGHDASHLEPSDLLPVDTPVNTLADSSVDSPVDSPVDSLVCSMAVPNDHPEIVAARARGVRVCYRIELLADLLASRRAIAVTGTHGKSTTTGMVSQVFLGCGVDASALIGGHSPYLQARNCEQGAAHEGLASNIYYGQDDVFIAEIDESDPGFAQVAAELAIVTNLEDDHIAGDFDERRNYHASLADLEAAVRAFTQKAKCSLYCADWPELAAHIDGNGNTFSYGFAKGADYQAQEVVLEPTSSHFVLTYPATKGVGRLAVKLAVPGKHNVQNAVAALAAAHIFGLDMTQAADALASFAGVGRRWQRLGSWRGALVIDDYAHHPTEVRVTLEAAKRTGKRVRAVLQPHRWVRTARHWRALADAACLADEVLVLDIYAAGETPIAGVSSEAIAERVHAAGVSARYYDAAAAERYLLQSLAGDDLIITLGAGDVWKVGRNLLSACGGDDGSA